ncbi:IS1/IS1595 family N-terminal zinc-binding domain-containing protein [Spirosoma aerolatum]
MLLEAIACKHCGQTQHVKRYDTTRSGTQRYRCYDCGRTALVARFECSQLRIDACIGIFHALSALA